MQSTRRLDEKHWIIKSTNNVAVEIQRHKGKCCRVILAVKYEDELDTLDLEIWMVPGWTPGDIWRRADEIIRENNRYYYAICKYYVQVEEAELRSFQLI